MMRRVTSDRPRGITWGLTARLEDCDFADDIALLAHTQKDMQEKTERVDNVGRSVGLNISQGKTKLMKMKNRSQVESQFRAKSSRRCSTLKILEATSQRRATLRKRFLQ